MLLRVRLASIGGGKRIHPREGLWNGLHLDKVHDESGLPMSESGAEGLIAVVQVQRDCIKAVAACLFR